MPAGDFFHFAVAQPGRSRTDRFMYGVDLSLFPAIMYVEVQFVIVMTAAHALCCSTLQRKTIELLTFSFGGVLVWKRNTSPPQITQWWCLELFPFVSRLLREKRLMEKCLFNVTVTLKVLEWSQTEQLVLLPHCERTVWTVASWRFEYL